MTDWSSLRVVDLKAELSSRGLSTKGVKADLVQRLTEDDETAAQPEEEPATADATAMNEAASTVEAGPEHEISEPQSIATESSSIDATANDNTSTQPQIAPNAQTETEAKVLPSQEPASSENHTAQVENDEQPILDTTLPPVDTAADLQKRKRRSSTPPPSTKRARQEGERLAEDREDVVDFENGDISISPKKSQNGIEKKEVPTDDVEIADGLKRKEDPADDQSVEANQQQSSAPGPNSDVKAIAMPEQLDLPATTVAPTQDVSLDETGEDAYAKRVAIAESQSAPPTQSKHDLYDDGKHDASQLQGVQVEEESPAIPSLHAPTSALYIRELMRPLRSEVMEQHIVDLVTPSGKETDADLIRDFYLDQIRTHAFVLLASVPAAQRVRAALHNQIWPNERNRKTLWVDFIPDESVKNWIAKEESAPKSARWEVVYEQDGGSTVAIHREIGSDSKSFSRPPPTGPAATAGPVYPGIEAAPRGPRGGGGGGRPPYQNPHNRQTDTKPQLTYTPKDEDVARRRMENMRSFYARDPPADLGKDYHRFTFESADAFVDRGREVFIGIRPPHRQKEHEERLRRERLGTAGAGSAAESRRDDYRPAPRPSVTDEDRFSRYNDRRSDRPPRTRGFRSDRGPGRFRGEDPYRYRPGY